MCTRGLCACDTPIMHYCSHLQRRKLRLREVKSLVQGHTGDTWQSHSRKPICLRSQLDPFSQAPSRENLALFSLFTHNPSRFCQPLGRNEAA